MLGGLALLVGELSPREALQAVDRRSQRALASARDALLGRAASDDNRPGSLPCPALDDNGQVPLFVGDRCPAYVGRFPWKALKTGELRDGHGQLLWYALAPALRDSPAAEPVNGLTTAELSLDDQSAIAAIIFSPGPPLAGQARDAGDAIGDYLDGSNADGDHAYVAGQASATFNDRSLAISQTMLFGLVGKRILGEFRGSEARGPARPATGLHRYHDDFGQFPWADSDGDGRADDNATSGLPPTDDLLLPDWLRRNRWQDVVRYHRDNASAARLSLGSGELAVAPCRSLPCQ